MDMSSYYQEHADLAAIITRLKAQLAKGSPRSADAAAAVAAELMALTSKLSVHLGKEDLHLYPKLIGSNGPEKALAQSFQKEMGGLKDAYMAFKSRWGIAAKITAAPDDFVKDARGVIQALEGRIRRENTELYKAAEKA